MYQKDIEFFSALLTGEIKITDDGEVVETGKTVQESVTPTVEEKENAEIFSGKYSKGETFQATDGKYYAAIEDSFHHDGDVEEAFDVFLPGDGWYVHACPALPEEIPAKPVILTPDQLPEGTRIVEKSSGRHGVAVRTRENAIGQMCVDWIVDGLERPQFGSIAQFGLE